MRLASVYTTTCVCGAALESPTPETTCEKCGMVARMVWPVPYATPPEVQR